MATRSALRCSMTSQRPSLQCGQHSTSMAATRRMKACASSAGLRVGRGHRQGTKSAVMTAHKRSDPISQWAAALRDRIGWQKAAVALANKNARILWAVMTKGEAFDARHVSVKPGASTPTAAIA